MAKTRLNKRNATYEHSLPSDINDSLSSSLSVRLMMQFGYVSLTLTFGFQQLLNSATWSSTLDDKSVGLSLCIPR